MRGRSSPLWAAAVLLAGTTAGAVLGLLAASSLEAQVVTGQVVEAEGGQGVEGALVEVMDREGRRVGMALSDRRGSFRVELSRPGGPFLLEVWAMNHRRHVIDSLEVAEGETVDLDEIRLHRSPIPLDTVQVEVQRGRITGRERVRRRQLLGQGTFLAGAVVARDRPYSLTEYVAAQSDLMLRRMGRRGYFYNPRALRPCVVIHINHWPIENTTYRTLDDIPLSWIAAIEIYDTWDETPPDARMMSDTDWRGCGLVNVWLWNSW